MYYDHDVEALVAWGKSGITVWLLLGLSLLAFAASLCLGVA